MFRRVANGAAARGRLSAAGLLTTVPTVFTPQSQVQARWAGTEAAAGNAVRSSSGSNNNNNRNRQPARRTALPPAFDIVHWNEEDASKGFLLRVLYRNGYIALDYHRQRPDSEANTNATTGRRENRAVKVVTVTLPPVYVARFLGVLEGRMNSVEVQSRFTNATFAPDAAAGRHHHTLHCVSTKPSTGQAQTVDGVDVHEETVEWTVQMDAAESLMLQRFLTQALHQNSGFGRVA